MFRLTFHLVGGAAGAWGALRLLNLWIDQHGGSASAGGPEQLPVLIPLGMVGAAAGLFLAAILYPGKR